MAKVRIGNPTVKPENREWLEAEARRARRTIPELVDMLLDHARERNLDLSSGQARETAAALGNRP
jgi:hypothetical protein